MEVTKDNMLKQFADVFNLEYNEKNEEWTHTVNLKDENDEDRIVKQKITMKKYKLMKLIRSLKKLEFENICLYQHKSFEKLVSIHSREISYSDFFPGIDKDKDIIKTDKNTGLTFKISTPSLDFIIASYLTLMNNKKNIKSINNCPALFIAQISKSGILGKILDLDNIDSIIQSIKILMFFYDDIEIDKENENVQRKKKNDFEDFMTNNVFANVKTIQISSSNNLNLETFEKLSDSFIFSIGYNVNIPILEFKYYKDDIEYNPRLNLDEIEIPKRNYIKELIYYYQQALSADNPLLEYLSFYQILEYFYGIVAREELMKEVKNKISHPKFSHMNDESVLQLIDTVRKGKFEEPRALISVLKRYVKLDELKKDLKNYCKNENYYEYYLKNKTNFANAKSIKENKNKIVIDTLSNRIYDVRNALIHSKEGEKCRYVPFSENEIELRNEIPLIRLVAEQIIINSSKDLELN